MEQTNVIRQAALREAKAWHRLCLDGTSGKLKEKHQAAREKLADAMRLRGRDRYWAGWIFERMTL